MNIAVITCDVLTEEIQHFAKNLPQVKAIHALEQGLHSFPEQLRAKVQEAIDAVEADPEIDAIVLGYGLCSRGVEGCGTERCQFVVARAHDCITLLLGSKERYSEYVKKNPGTYWYSVGWNRAHLIPGPERVEYYRREYVEKYGEENADYLMEMEQQWLRDYTRATFIDFGGIGDEEAEATRTKACADWLGWEYDRVQGDTRLLTDLLAGTWDDQRFLVLQPGEKIRYTITDRVMDAEPCKNCPR